MKLFTFDPAPNPMRLKLFLAYKDIDVETEQVDLAKAAQLNEDFKAIAPNATVPTLVLDNGTCLTEVIAIVQYLEALHPEKPLLGVTPLEKALVLNWCHRIFNTVFMAAAEVFRNTHPAYENRALPGPRDYQQIPALAERGQARMLHAFEDLDGELGGREWLAGDSFSQADIDLVALWVFAGWAAKIKPDPSLENLAAWHERAQAKLGL